MPCRPWPNSWNRVRASSGDSSDGSPSAPLEKLQTLMIKGATAPSSFCWSRSEVIQAGALRGAGEGVALEKRLVPAGGILHLPDPDGRMPDRNILALAEGDAEQAGGAVEGGVDHVVEHQIRLDRGVVEIGAALPQLFGVVAQ